ncbi:MAG: hypothetical protein HGA45_31595, partial [Chloroflexales bacterium]|nr:hypothetical protein [Chloroflexales bacterium]
VPATAVGLQSNRPFRFYVRALDTYFRTSGAATPWDCSPGSATGQPCGSATHTVQTGALRFRPTVTTLSVPPEGSSSLFFVEDPGGTAGSPSQIGLLLLFRDAQPNHEAAGVLLR